MWVKHGVGEKEVGDVRAAWHERFLKMKVGDCQILLLF